MQSGLPIHALTEIGLEAARAHVEKARRGADPEVPTELLFGSPYVEVIPPGIFFEKRTFDNRLELAVYLAERFEHLHLRPQQILDNYGLWSWLGLYYFEDFVRRDQKGQIASDFLTECFVITNSSHSRYVRNRHYFYIAYQLQQKHGDHVDLLLKEKVNSWGKLADRVTGKQAVFNSPSVVELIMKLYRASDGTLKPSATNDKKAGSLKRFLSVLDQLERTYDIYAMPVDKIIRLLPSEFNVWLGDEAAQSSLDDAATEDGLSASENFQDDALTSDKFAEPSAPITILPADDTPALADVVRETPAEKLETTGAVSWRVDDVRGSSKNPTAAFVDIFNALYDLVGEEGFAVLQERLAARGPRRAIAKERIGLRQDQNTNANSFKEAKHLNSGWWLDTNLGTKAKKARVRKTGELLNSALGLNITMELQSP